MIRILFESFYGSIPILKGGTDKQRNWAEDIRKEWISRAETSMASSFLSLLKSFSAERVGNPSGNKAWARELDNFRRQHLAIEALLSKADNAIWWIEHGQKSPLTMKGYYVPYGHLPNYSNQEAWEPDDSIKDAVERATGVKDGHLLRIRGDGLEFNRKPGASEYTDRAYRFAEWLADSNPPSASVKYEDLERFATVQ